MSPSSPSFATDGGTLALVSANAACSGSNDTTDFGVGNSPYRITYNGAAAAGSHNTCVRASASGITSAFQQISVTINPTGGGVACDIGPNYVGAIPGPAAAMGFTTCLNFDFAYTGTFTNRVAFLNHNIVTVPANQTYQWSNQASWLYEAGAGNAALWAGGTFNSGAYQLVQDGGTQVLLSQWTPNDNTSQINSPFFPLTNMFLEEEVRIDPNAYVNVTSTVNTEIIDDFGFFGNKPGGTAGLEVDAGTSCPAVPPSTATAWASGGNNTACTGNGTFYVSADGTTFVGQPSYFPCCNINPSDGSYHVNAMLVVSSRTNNTIGTCGYYDRQWADGRGFGPCWAPCHTFGGCGDACTFETSAICWESGTTAIGTYVTGASSSSGPGRHWVRRITIWTCAGWNTPSSSGNGYTADNSCDSGSNVFNAVGGNQSGPSY
jgi:hypothetical protein